MVEEDPKAREEYLTHHKLRNDDPRVIHVGCFLPKTIPAQDEPRRAAPASERSA